MSAVSNITILGSGDTLGTPVIGSRTAACLDSDPKSKRFRFGVLLRLGETTILVDPNPDLKWQCLQHNFELREVDHVLITHHHADHTNGMGEFFYRRAQPTQVWYGDYPFNRTHMQYWHYLENERVLQFKTFVNYRSFQPASGITVTPVTLSHGGGPASGFVIEYQGTKIAVITDTNDRLAPQTLQALHQVGVLSADTFSEDLDQVHQLYQEIGASASPSLETTWPHMTIQQSMALRQEVHAKTLYTIHMSRFMAPHQQLVELYESEHVKIGWDGLVIPL